MTITIDSILSKLDPKTRARVQSAQDVKVEKLKHEIKVKKSKQISLDSFFN